MIDNVKGEIELVVAEAKNRDVIRGKIRLNNEAMNAIGISTGEIVELKGKKVTAAVAWPAYPEDLNKQIIRMDGVIRKNAGVSLSEKVIIKKAEIKAANKIIFAPGEINFNTDFGFVRFVKRKLKGYPLTLQDTVMIPVLGRANPFVVINSDPEGIVLINDDTKIEITDKPASEINSANISTINYEDIGGLEEVIQ